MHCTAFGYTMPPHDSESPGYLRLPPLRAVPQNPSNRVYEVVIWSTIKHELDLAPIMRSSKYCETGENRTGVREETLNATGLGRWCRCERLGLSGTPPVARGSCRAWASTPERKKISSFV